MKSHTRSVNIAAKAAVVFDFIAKVENLPRWAIHYAKAVKEVDGRKKVVTPQGELFVRHEIDRATGVIDMLSGPTADQMALFPTRVVATPDGGSFFLFTALQQPGIDEESFEQMCAPLEEELEALKAVLETGV